jgi:hypothetical protein
VRHACRRSSDITDCHKTSSVISIMRR